jgi:hypothetical protein
MKEIKEKSKSLKAERIHELFKMGQLMSLCIHEWWFKYTDEIRVVSFVFDTWKWRFSNVSSAWLCKKFWKFLSEQPNTASRVLDQPGLISWSIMKKSKRISNKIMIQA